MKLVGTRSDVNVFRIAASAWDTLQSIEVVLPNATPTTSVIINVLFDTDYTGAGSDPSGTTDANRTHATNVTMSAFDMFGTIAEGDLSSRVIWNFPYAKNIQLSRVAFLGSMLAPDAGTPEILNDCFPRCWLVVVVGAVVAGCGHIDGHVLLLLLYLLCSGELCIG